MRVRKQSMREVRDAATVERIVETIGSIALEMAAKRNDVPGNKPRYFRGALIKPK